MTTPYERSASRYHITFKNVGRGKASWVEVLKQKPTETILQRLVRKSGALMSRDIVCDFDESGDAGTVYAGIRPVGTFEVKLLVIDNPGPFDVDHIALAMGGDA